MSTRTTGKIGDPHRHILSLNQRYFNAVENGRMSLAYSVVDNLNHIMPNDRDPKNVPYRKYGVIKSDEVYREKMTQQDIILCPNVQCKGHLDGAEYDNSQVGIRDTRQHEYDYSDMQKRRYNAVKRVHIWTCPICNTVHDMQDIRGVYILRPRSRETIQPNPLRVVPMPPTKQQLIDQGGMTAIQDWGKQMEVYLYNYHSEVMQELTRYRLDQIAQGLMSDDTIMYDTQDVTA